MIRLIPIFAAFIISCSDSPDSNEESKLVVSNDTLPSEVLTEETTVNSYDKIEADVLNTIDSITKCSANTLKSHLKQYVLYEDKVDGAIAERYFNFAFEFVDENYARFFSVLDNNDSTLVIHWSKIASNEVDLAVFNLDSPDEYLNDLTLSYQEKLALLSEDKASIGKTYFTYLIQNTQQE